MDSNYEYLEEEKSHLESQMLSGANWFFWIAGLSLVNSLVFMFGGQVNFIIGMGVTQIIDGIGFELANGMGNSALAFFFGVNVFIVGFFVLFGYFARLGNRWAFAIGMIVYSLDGLLFLFVQDFVGIGFHGLALFYLFRGVKACGMLHESKFKAMNTIGQLR
ncbi:MAG: hypothetical protein ACE5HS_06125 [bacterium]